MKVPEYWLGQTSVMARVYYQSMTREHIEFLAAENVTDDRGTKLLSIYEATGAAGPMMIAESSWEIIVAKDQAPKAPSLGGENGCSLQGAMGPDKRLGWAATLLVMLAGLARRRRRTLDTSF